MNSLNFFIRRPVNIPELRLLGLLYAAKMTALEQNSGACHILIRLVAFSFVDQQT